MKVHAFSLRAIYILSIYLTMIIDIDKTSSIYEEGDVVSFLKDVIFSHSSRGAYNIIMARANSKL